MLDIRDLTRQMTTEEYDTFYSSLANKKAEKSIKLLELLRDSDKDDRQIADILQVNSTAYYTLRSRLNDKIQEFLLQKVKGSKVEILEKVNNIDYILFNYNKTQAINIIKKLENELIKFEKPTYLINVYDALKRLHKSSPLYYNYSQQYNEHVAFLLDYDKIIELYGDFIETLGKYLLSKLPEDLEHINLILDQVDNQHNIRESHRMTIIQSLTHISYQLFLLDQEQSKDLDPVEDILQNVYKIIDAHPDDVLYNNMKLLFDFLSFLYYHIHKIKKKEEEFFIVIQEDETRFLNSFSFYTIPSLFLFSKVQKQVSKGETELLCTQMKEEVGALDINKDDLINFINLHIYQAVCCYYSGDYQEATNYLSDLRNKVIFKAFPHVETEIKLFLSLNYYLMDEHELCLSLLKSVGRKVLVHQHYDYENAKVFKKAIIVAINTTSREKAEKLNRLRLEYKISNDGIYRIMPYIDIDDMFSRL